ncbi:AAA family ATPase [Crenobacter cavernae]|uniref:Nicotinamide mononucleotide-binding protein n=1 Tax=Crenobacter cavernae TaxID=2290923 RepID=A0A345Y2Q4_9NEIS|nr:AAA family ATPase [Crenobacter cavernae]AXK38206.1 nicotinamide mononucleotide-binding protein [Crenobacter cavernae]
MSLPAVTRIALVGPESCGKSALAAALAHSLAEQGARVARIDEYARHYYATRPYRPTMADIEAIAAGQLAAEAVAVGAGARVLVCDSTVLTCVVWAEVAFGEASRVLHALNRPRDYALTLLPLPDLPWAPDPLRSHPDERDMLFARYRAKLTAAGVASAEIGGLDQARVDAAWQALRAARLA